NPVVTDWLAGYQAGKIRIFSVVTVRGVKMIEDKRWCGKWAGGQIALLLGPRFLTAMLQTDEKQTSPLRTLLPTVTPAEDHPEGFSAQLCGIQGEIVDKVGPFPGIFPVASGGVDALGQGLRGQIAYGLVQKRHREGILLLG